MVAAWSTVAIRGRCPCFSYNLAIRRTRPLCSSCKPLSKDHVWDGLEEGEGKQKRIICNGLLRDVEGWRAKGNGAFDLLGGVLRQLSEGENEILRIGEGVRVRLDDVRDIPTLKMPYAQVPVTQAAAGMRRVLALAYLLVWVWDGPEACLRRF